MQLTAAQCLTWSSDMLGCGRRKTVLSSRDHCVSVSQTGHDMYLLVNCGLRCKGLPQNCDSINAGDDSGGGGDDGSG